MQPCDRNLNSGHLLKASPMSSWCPKTLSVSRMNLLSIEILLALLCISSQFATLVAANSDLPLPITNNLQGNDDAHDIPDGCESCKLLVKSFEKGLEKTMRGKHEGGDTSWEEKNLKSYTDSEVRLIEIQEELCEDVSKGKAQCLSMAEETESDIEEWWFKYRNKNVRLHDFLCINRLKKCCADGAFGPNCQKCPSDCNGHGVCDGSGTRSGTGNCICSTGYTGDKCENCDEDYYDVFSKVDHDESSTCLPCHKACKGGCNGPSATNCTECRPGYKRDSKTNGCIDINECELGPNEIEIEARKLCPDGTYCVNTEGHYKCAHCHRACSTCLAYGRDKCLTCAPDHFMDDDHNCVFSHEIPTYDPNRTKDETIVASMFRIFKTHVVMDLMICLLFYQLLKLGIEMNNLFDLRFRNSIAIFLAACLTICTSSYIRMLIVTNFGRNEEAMAELKQKQQVEL